MINDCGFLRCDFRIRPVAFVRRNLVSYAVLCVLALSAHLAAAAELVGSPEPGWPQWRGPKRDGNSLETGLLSAWPTTGPSLKWKAEGLGFGYSAPIIVRDRIYLTGDLDGALRVFALDRGGKMQWQATNGAAWKGPYPGARASCTFSEGRLYHLNAHGRLACMDANTGQELWAINVLEQFGGKNLTWAMSECLLVDGPYVFVTAGGSKALVAALDKRTGQTRWTTPGLRISGNDKTRSDRGESFDLAGYGSPILCKINRRKVVINSSQAHVFGVDASSGELLWTHHLPTRYWVIAATPVLADNAVFVTAPDTSATRLLRLHPEGESIDPSWKTDFDNGHGGVIRVGEELFGSWYRRKGWAGVDLKTGATRQRLDDLASGSVMMADGHLYCLGQDGEMALVQPSGQGSYRIVSRFKLTAEKKNDVWTHPVILEGNMYLRYHERLYRYGIKAENVKGS